MENTLSLSQHRKLLRAAVIVSDCLALQALFLSYLPYIEPFRFIPAEGTEYLEYFFTKLIDGSPLYLIPQLLTCILYATYVHRCEDAPAPGARVKKRLLRFGIGFAIFCAVSLLSNYFPEHWERCVAIACCALIYVLWLLLPLPLYRFAKLEPRKRARIIPAGMLVSVLFVIIALIMNFSGGCIRYRGFALDSERNIYLGRPQSIAVYSFRRTPLRRIDLGSRDPYSFTIQGDRLLIQDQKGSHVLDLQGNAVEEPSIDSATISNISKNAFTDAKGAEYRMDESHLSVFIKQNIDGEFISIFDMPLRDYLPRTLFYVGIVLFAAFLLIWAIRWVILRQLK